MTGKPAAVGRYSVTVTPPAGAAPASMPFAWDVHGTIAPSTVNRASTAGTPVWFRVATSGPDQNVGFAPTLKATGLPAGVSMTSAGVITGWPTRPGTYKVTVSAADALGGTGTATFTWTVKAAADSGTAGVVRQVGGSGKCLNDPGGNTANGTRPTCGPATASPSSAGPSCRTGRCGPAASASVRSATAPPAAPSSSSSRATPGTGRSTGSQAPTASSSTRSRASASTSRSPAPPTAPSR